MGIRSRLKGAIKRAVIGEADSPGSAPRTESAPTPGVPKPSDNEGRGNLADGEDVPWYLEDGDVDGWDSTDGKDDLDED